MRKLIARYVLGKFRKRYDYDTAYLEAMLEHSPSAFFKFAKFGAIANHHEAVPGEARFAAKLMGALAEDCGPCTQLVVNMALEANVPNTQIEAILARDTRAMSRNTLLAFRFADAIVQRSAAEDETRDAVRAEWGEKGVIDLTLALQASRLFPMIKAGLGYARECRRVTIHGRNIDVVKQAA